MKRFLILVLTFIMAFTLISCGNDETVVQDGMKLAGKEAGNEAVEYTFTYPEAWTMIRNDGVIELQYDCDESAMTAKYATVAVLAFGLENAEQSAKDYWKDYKTELESLYTDFKELDSKEVKVDDTAALKVKYSGKLNGSSYHYEQVIICRAGSVYLITLSSPSEHFEAVSTVVKSIIDNFKFHDEIF